MGVVHALGEGTDAGRAWFLALVAIAVVPTLVLLLARLGLRSGRLLPTPTTTPDLRGQP